MLPPFQTLLPLLGHPLIWAQAAAQCPSYNPFDKWFCWIEINDSIKISVSTHTISYTFHKSYTLVLHPRKLINIIFVTFKGILTNYQVYNNFLGQLVLCRAIRLLNLIETRHFLINSCINCFALLWQSWDHNSKKREEMFSPTRTCALVLWN